MPGHLVQPQQQGVQRQTRSMPPTTAFGDQASTSASVGAGEVAQLRRQLAEAQAQVQYLTGALRTAQGTMKQLQVSWIKGWLKALDLTDQGLEVII